jgi:O-antigen ligase
MTRLIQQAISVTFFLYAVSTLTTMAGMEIFGWLTFALVMALTWIERREPGRGFFKLGPDWALLGFFVAAILALALNGSADADWKFSLGGQRWILLVYMTAYAARTTKVSEKAFLPLLIVASIACAHGILEYITGWDYVRHQAAFISDTGVARAAGLFSLPTRFASSFGMVLCFIVAALLLRLRRDFKGGAVLWISLVVVSTALVLSGTRGALLAILAALGVICFLISRRLVVAGFVILIITIGGFYVSSTSFHARVQTLFDMKYESNADRLALWRVNVDIFKHYPVFGIGLDENERRKTELATAYGDPVPHQGQAHNTYLQLASGSGALGLLCYLIIVGTFLIYTIRLWRVILADQIWYRTLVLGALGAQISLHLGGLVDCNFRASEVRHLFILILGVVVWLKNANLPALGYRAKSRMPAAKL